MTKASPQPNPDTRFTRSAWLIAGYTAVLLVYGIAFVVYGFTLVTDGWDVTESGDVGYGYLYTQNLMGMSSGLRPGDKVVAVEGYPIDWTTAPTELKNMWQAGTTLNYTVIRAERETQVTVTLVRWQFWKWLLMKLRDPYFLVIQLSIYFLLALAMLVFRRRPGNPTAGAFLMLMATLGLSTIRDLHAVGLSGWIDPLANVLSGSTAQSFEYGALIPYIFIHFALVFPHPKPILLRYPWLDYVPVAIGLVMVAFSGSPIGWFWFLLSLVLTVAILVHNAFTMRDVVSRAQINWGLGGLIIGIGWLALALIISTFGQLELNQAFFGLVSAGAFLVMGVFLAVAITRYRLFDIDIIIRKTLVYALLTGLLSLVYFGGVALLQALLSGVEAQSSPIVIVITTLLTAALFNPLRRRLQDFIDRRFYRQKYDAEKALSDFAAFARSETDLAQLSNHLAVTVQDTLHPIQVNLWMQRAARKPAPDPHSTR